MPSDFNSWEILTSTPATWHALESLDEQDCEETFVSLQQIYLPLKKESKATVYEQASLSSTSGISGSLVIFHKVISDEDCHSIDQISIRIFVIESKSKYC